MSDVPTEPMRVVFLTHAARLSGGEIGLVRFIEATRGRIDATVLLAEDGDLVPALRAAGAAVEVLPLAESTRGLKRAEIARPGLTQARAALEVVRYVGSLARRLRALDPAIVHAISLKSGPYGGAAARLAGVPMVWHLHDSLTPSYLSPRLIAPVQLMISTLPTGLLTPSRSVMRTVGRGRRGLVTDVMPFPVPQPAESFAIRPEVRTVGMLGRITPWKGQDVFLKAFALAFPDGDVQARLIGNAMFGETDFEEELHRIAARLGIAERVDFRGFQPDPWAELRELDIVVHASVSPDPLPGVVIEGMSAGLPVIAADSGGSPEHVRDGVNGFLHRPGDPESLAGALRRAAGTPEERAAIGAAARTTAHQYSPEVIVERMLAFYERVIAA